MAVAREMKEDLILIALFSWISRADNTTVLATCTVVRNWATENPRATGTRAVTVRGVSMMCCVLQKRDRARFMRNDCHRRYLTVSAEGQRCAGRKQLVLGVRVLIS